MFSENETEAEIKLGILTKVPTYLVPTYKVWLKRREPWLLPIQAAEQYDEDQP